MKSFFVVGNPIQHSLSPLIFKHWFNKYKIKALYKKKLIKNKNTEEKILKTIRKKKCFGINITAPHKQRASNIVDKIEPAAKKIGAINCIYKRNSLLIGANTDWQGFIKALNETTPKKNLKKQTVVLIGFGGAAKAILYSLIKNKTKKIIIIVRDVSKTKKETQKVKKILIKPIKHINKAVKEADIVVNTTPIKNLKKLGLKYSSLKKTTIASDINYSPHETQFIKSALKMNLKVVYGIDMLIHQAVPSFTYWFGFKPSIDVELRKKCLKEIKKR